MSRGQPVPADQTAVWLLWDCTDLVAAFTSEADAIQARADLQHRVRCEYGPGDDLQAGITLTTAWLQTAHPRTGRHRP
jgi:hypothetical protein